MRSSSLSAGLYRSAVLCVVVAFFCGASTRLHAADEDAQAKREAAFEKLLSNVTLTGSFTVDGKMDEAPKAESYRIESVKNITGNLWTFTTHIRYGKVDTKLPITVPVEWAGDTPMVSLTNATLPGLGEAFSARVIFYDGRYAGTWQHGKVGGHMFGSIKPTKAEE